MRRNWWGLMESVLVIVPLIALIVLSTEHAVLQIKYADLLNETRKSENHQLRSELKAYKAYSNTRIVTKEEFDVIVTAYCPCELCCQKFADGLTSTGKNAYTPGVAVDPKVIPLGSIVFIPGYGSVEADDVGGSIKGDKIDVRFRTHREAKEWGRKKLRITVFREL